MFREFLSLLFFNTALGNGYYENPDLASLIIVVISLITLFTIYKFLNLINTNLMFIFSIILTSVVVLNVLRYPPFGGDAVIYCEINQAVLNSSNSIYDLELKYTFNYPPMYKYLIKSICSFDYFNWYPFITFLSLLIIFPKNQAPKNSLLVLLYFFGSFLALRWVLKTGNFVFFEIIFLNYFVKNYKKNKEINYLLLFLFGFQRLWFLLLIPIIFIFDIKKNNSKKFIFPILIISLLNISELRNFISSLFGNGETYNLFIEIPGHNTPSIYLGLMNIFKVDSSLISLSIFVLSSLLIFKLLNVNKLNNINLFYIFSFFLIMNPYLKPYHFIFFLPLLQLINIEILREKSSIFLSLLAPNFLWILGSNINSGTNFGYFQIVIYSLFVFNVFKLNKENFYD